MSEVPRAGAVVIRPTCLEMDSIRHAENSARSRQIRLLPVLAQSKEAIRSDSPVACLEGPLGTGFFVRRHVLASTENIDIPTPQPSVHYYAITNRHVAIRDGATVIRINRKDGSTRLR